MCKVRLAEQGGITESEFTTFTLQKKKNLKIMQEPKMRAKSTKIHTELSESYFLLCSLLSALYHQYAWKSREVVCLFVCLFLFDSLSSMLLWSWRSAARLMKCLVIERQRVQLIMLSIWRKGRVDLDGWQILWKQVLVSVCAYSCVCSLSSIKWLCSSQKWD